MQAPPAEFDELKAAVLAAPVDVEELARMGQANKVG